MSQEHLFLSVEVSDGFLTTPLTFAAVQQWAAPRASNVFITGEFSLKAQWPGFPGGTVVKNPPANAGDTGSSHGPGRSHRLWSNWAHVDNYWACTLEPVSHNCWARVPQLLNPARLEPMLRNKRSYRSEKPTHHKEE